MNSTNRTLACGDAPSIAGKSCDEYPFETVPMTIRPFLERHGHTSEPLTVRLVDPSDLASYIMSMTSTLS